MQPPLITLTTDFGLQDHYVGTMKGVILSRCPGAQMIDISHEISPFSIHAGAYAIDQAAPFFPSGTVHLVVIDPGVGTKREPLLLQAMNQFFIAPDNGVLSFILMRDPGAIARRITNGELWLQPASTTFHGRDLFAPTAAAIAAGRVKPEDVGQIMHGPVTLAGLDAVLAEPNVWRGVVLSIDRFGNVITSFRVMSFTEALHAAFAIRAGKSEITVDRSTFGDAAPGLCFAYAGSSGFLELGINQGDAARALGLRPGDSLEFQAFG